MKLIDSTGLVLFTLFCSNATSSETPPSPPQDHLNYVISVIEHLARHQVGTFECVFEDLEFGYPFDGWFGQILSSPALTNVVKYVVNASFQGTYTNLPHKPSLVLMHIGNRVLQPITEPSNVRSSFFVMDSNTRVLVMVNVTCVKCVDRVTKLLRGWEFDRVVYMGVKRRVIVLLDHAGRITDHWIRFPQPGDLFKSYVRNMRWRDIRFTYKGNAWHPALKWTQETARFINSSALYVPMVCNGSMGVSECINQLMFGAYAVDMSIVMFSIVETTPEMYRMIFNNEPTSTVILVPQGRPFNEMEMFVKPFSWEVWIVLIGMLMLIEVLSLIFPALFKNDPILLLVFGYERYNLHAVSFGEKITFFPMIVFFFLILHAYETKIISFMINKPSIGTIESFQDLLQSGLKIKAFLDLDLQIQNDSILGPLVIPMGSKETLLRLDGVNAYMGQSIDAAHVISQLSNYDFKLHRPKYAVIDEKRKTTVGAYWIGLKTPLAELLHFTHRAFFESGLLDVWKEENFHLYSMADRDEFGKIEIENLGLLTFEDLMSTWLALVIGLSISSVVFVLELMVKCCDRFLKDIGEF